MCILSESTVMCQQFSGSTSHETADVRSGVRGVVAPQCGSGRRGHGRGDSLYGGTDERRADRCRDGQLHLQGAVQSERTEVVERVEFGADCSGAEPTDDGSDGH